MSSYVNQGRLGNKLYHLRFLALTLITRPPRPSLNCLGFDENVACAPMKFRSSSIKHTADRQLGLLRRASRSTGGS